MKNVIVIGGGPAGMLAAVAAAQQGCQVTLLEKNEKLGKKLFITGKGRCNVTNAADMETLFANVMTNRKFLYSAFYNFDNQAIMNFLEQAGCRLKVERGDRVFPVSDHSSDVIAALNRELHKNNVQVQLNTQVQDLLFYEPNSDMQHRKEQEQKIQPDNQEMSMQLMHNIPQKKQKDKAQNSILRIKGVVLKDHTVLLADAVIVATGGLSYPSTGSTGDGYRFAEKTGHQLTERRPSLVPFHIQESWCKDLMGLSLKNVTVRLTAGNKELYKDFGEMLFTHFGVSGPLILRASSYYSQFLIGKGKKSNQSEINTKESHQIKLFIDLKPALDMEQLDKRLIREFEEHKNKQFANSLSKLFPAKLIPVMISLSEIHPEKRVNEITRTERIGFGELIKNLPLTVTGIRDYQEAIITKGGISVKDINPSTMESKLISGLFFAGEVLDLDALTGGFNLQIAWSTGYLAGQSTVAGN